MARAHHTFGLVAATLVVGCAPPVLDKYMGRPILDPMLDFGKPDQVFDLPDGRRAFQWQVEKDGVRPSPRPVIGVGIGVGQGGWSNVTTVGTSYEHYTKSCLYTLVGTRSGADWIVSGLRKPAPGCA